MDVPLEKAPKLHIQLITKLSDIKSGGTVQLYCYVEGMCGVMPTQRFVRRMIGRPPTESSCLVISIGFLAKQYLRDKGRPPADLRL